MASIYKRKDSPFFWIKYFERGRMMQRSTGCRWEVAQDVRRAKLLCAEKTADELRGARNPRHDRGQGWAWVADFIATRYGASLTGRSYRCAWTSLKMFLEENQIDAPAALSRHNCFDYIAWRKTANPQQGRYAAGHNTALMELRILGLIMNEAVNRELARGNPCLALKIKRHPPKVKPELTESDCRKIRAGILATADPEIREMLHYSFEISRYQGCRLMETRLNPQMDVKLFTVPGPDGQPMQRGTIYFRTKGQKEFTTVLHPNLLAMFRELQAAGRTYTWKTPKDRTYGWAATHWWYFLRRIGLKAAGVTIHCSRVTVISELARNNVPESKAKSLVGHSSTLSHRIYQRLRLDDLYDSMNEVGKKSDPPA